MNIDFWRERWRSGQIGFHRPAPNPFLVRHHALLGPPPRRVLVPLCGKSVDLTFLAEAGHEVVGVEAVEEAARAYFDERGMRSERLAGPGPLRLAGGGVTLVVDDFLRVGPEQIGAFDAAYDRAALIALPGEVRGAYVRHLSGLVRPGGRILLVTLEFDGPPVGPPFSVPGEEIRALYGEEAASIELLEEVDATADSPRIVERGATWVRERAWLITRAEPGGRTS